MKQVVKAGGWYYVFDPDEIKTQPIDVAQVLHDARCDFPAYMQQLEEFLHSQRP